MKVLVEMMLAGFAPSSRLIECSMPAYRSLMVTLPMSSAAKDWLLEKLSPPLACNGTLAFLGTTAMSVEQGREDTAGSHGPPGLSSETLPQSPGETHTHTRLGCVTA